MIIPSLKNKQLKVVLCVKADIEMVKCSHFINVNVKFKTIGKTCDEKVENVANP